MSPEPSVSDKVFRNTLFNVIGTFWKMGIALAITPFIIAHVGIDRYGIWALVSILTGYFGLLDFGISASFIKYISEFYARKEYGRISQLVSTGAAFYLAFAILISVMAFLFLGSIIRLLHLSPELYDEAYFVLFLGIMLFGATNVINAFGAMQGGLQRMDVTNKINILVSIPMVIGTFFFMENGYGPRGLMINNVIIFLITGVLNVAVAYKLLPQLRVGISLVSRDMLGKLFRFGYKIQVGNVGDIVAFQTDRLIIAYFLNMGMVGYYQLGSQISQTIRSIPTLFLSALLPAASEINAANDRAKLEHLYLKGSKYIMFISFPLTFFVIAAANIIMLIWMGPGYEQSVWIIQILMLGYLANLICGVAVTIGAAIEKPELQMNASIITIVVNIVLSLILINMIGYIGVAIGTAVSLILGPIYYFVKFHGEIQLSLGKLIRDVALLPMAASIVPAVAVYTIYLALVAADVPTDRLVSLAVLGGMGAVFFAIYLLIIGYYRYFDKFDLDLMRKYFAIEKAMVLLNTYIRLK
jgi:O-antigen/teichoic acid export membrane protein